MAQQYPSKFYAPRPGLWQLVFWGGFALLTILAGIPMLPTDERNVGGFFVMLGCFAIFVGFGISTWIERKRSRNPALEVTELGLVFWRGSWRETTLPWDGLEKVWESGGSDSHIIFQPKDLKKYGRRIFLVLRAGPSVPVKTAAEDGTRLAAIIQQIWEQHQSGPVM
jgi:hypothetical protein